MSQPELAAFAAVLVSLLTVLGNGIAWLSGWGRRRAEEEREGAEGEKASAESVHSIAQATKILIDPLRAELVLARQQAADLLAAMTAIQDRQRDLEADLAERLDRIHRMELELQSLRPYKRRVRELEMKCASYEDLLAESAKRERELRERLVAFEELLETGNGKKGEGPPGPDPGDPDA